MSVMYSCDGKAIITSVFSVTHDPSEIILIYAGFAA